MGAGLLGEEETLRWAIVAGHFVNSRFSILGRDFQILSLNRLQIYAFKLWNTLNIQKGINNNIMNPSVANAQS